MAGNFEKNPKTKKGFKKDAHNLNIGEKREKEKNRKKEEKEQRSVKQADSFNSEEEGSKEQTDSIKLNEILNYLSKDSNKPIDKEILHFALDALENKKFTDEFFDSMEGDTDEEKKKTIDAWKNEIKKMIKQRESATEEENTEEINEKENAIDMIRKEFEEIRIKYKKNKNNFKIKTDTDQYIESLFHLLNKIRDLFKEDDPLKNNPNAIQLDSDINDYIESIRFDEDKLPDSEGAQEEKAEASYRSSGSVETVEHNPPYKELLDHIESNSDSLADKSIDELNNIIAELRDENSELAISIKKDIEGIYNNTRIKNLLEESGNIIQSDKNIRSEFIKIINEIINNKDIDESNIEDLELEDFDLETIASDDINFDDLFAESDEEARAEVSSAKELIEKFSPEQKKTFTERVANAGYTIDLWKNRVFEKMFSNIASSDKNKEQNAFQRRLRAYQEMYAKKADHSQQALNQVGKGFIKKWIGAGKGMGVVLRWGRILHDAYNVANPIRHVMMALTIGSTVAEGEKEARLKKHAVIEKTRIKDIDRAREEAWEVYKQAQVKIKNDEEITPEDLNKAYLKNLPKDLEKRLSNIDFSLSGIVKNHAELNMIWIVRGINKKINKITNSKIEEEEKEKKINDLISRYELALKDLDGIVGDSGRADYIAWMARSAQKTAQYAAVPLMIDTGFKAGSSALQFSWDCAKNVLANIKNTVENYFDSSIIEVDKLEELLSNDSADDILGMADNQEGELKYKYWYTAAQKYLDKGKRGEAQETLEKAYEKMLALDSYSELTKKIGVSLNQLGVAYGDDLNEASVSQTSQEVEKKIDDSESKKIDEQAKQRLEYYNKMSNMSEAEDAARQIKQDFEEYKSPADDMPHQQDMKMSIPKEPTDYVKQGYKPSDFAYKPEASSDADDVVVADDTESAVEQPEIETTEIKRDGWYNGRNEQRLWLGGINNTGFDADGQPVLDISKMTEDGSKMGDDVVNVEYLRTTDSDGDGYSDKLRALITLSSDEGNRVIEAPITTEGKVDFSALDEQVRDKIFSRGADGKLQVNCSSIEIGRQGAVDENGVSHYHIISTLEGNDALKEAGTEDISEKSVKETDAQTIKTIFKEETAPQAQAEAKQLGFDKQTAMRTLQEAGGEDIASIKDLTLDSAGGRQAPIGMNLVEAQTADKSTFYLFKDDEVIYKFSSDKAGDIIDDLKSYNDKIQRIIGSNDINAYEYMRAAGLDFNPEEGISGDNIKIFEQLVMSDIKAGDAQKVIELADYAKLDIDEVAPHFKVLNHEYLDKYQQSNILKVLNGEKINKIDYFKNMNIAGIKETANGLSFTYADKSSIGFTDKSVSYFDGEKTYSLPTIHNPKEFEILLKDPSAIRGGSEKIPVSDIPLETEKKVDVYNVPI